MAISVGYGLAERGNSFVPAGSVVCGDWANPPDVATAPHPGCFIAGLVEGNLARTQTVITYVGTGAPHEQRCFLRCFYDPSMWDIQELLVGQQAVLTGTHAKGRVDMWLTNSGSTVMCLREVLV